MAAATVKQIIEKRFTGEFVYGKDEPFQTKNVQGGTMHFKDYTYNSEGSSDDTLKGYYSTKPLKASKFLTEVSNAKELLKVVKGLSGEQVDYKYCGDNGVLGFTCNYAYDMDKGWYSSTEILYYLNYDKKLVECIKREPLSGDSYIKARFL